MVELLGVAPRIDSTVEAALDGRVESPVTETGADVSSVFGLDDLALLLSSFLLSLGILGNCVSPPITPGSPGAGSPGNAVPGELSRELP